MMAATTEILDRLTQWARQIEAHDWRADDLTHRSSAARGKERRRVISALCGSPTGLGSRSVTVFASCSGVGAARRAGALARRSVAWRSSGLGSRRGLRMPRGWHRLTRCGLAP